MPISWMSTKQHAIAPSSANSELYAMSTGVKIGLHISYIADELGMNIPKPITLLVDASAAIGFAQNVGSKTKMKHLDIRDQWVQ